MTASPREQIMLQLEKVIEPCSVSMGNTMTICDMGLVEDVRVDGDVVHVVLCLTDPSCINYGKIRQYITDVLLELGWVKQVEISHTMDVLWTPDRVRMSRRVIPIHAA